MRLLVSLSLAAALLASGAALAQSAPGAKSEVEQQQQRSVDQPGNNAPVMREIKSGQPQYTSIPGRETNVLVQPPARFLGQSATVTAGEAWRQFRNGPVTFIGGWLVVGVGLVILAFYFVFGPVKLHGKPTGRLVRRFSTVDQVVHWSVAISFCILGASGLIMLFGKHVLLPIIGYTLFAWLTSLGKNLHNFIAPFFIVSVIAMIVLYVRHNLPRLYDLNFLVNAIGVMTKGPRARIGGGEPLELAEVGHGLEHLAAPVETALLGQVTEARGHARVVRAPVDEEPPRRRRVDAEQGPDRARLPRSVRA